MSLKFEGVWKMGLSVNKKRFIFVLFVLSAFFISMVQWRKYQASHQLNLNPNDEQTEKKISLEDQLKEELKAHEIDAAEVVAAKKYFNELIETDKNFAASYLVYRLFMGDVDGGFAAARSMALYGRMGGGAQLDQLQAWTSNETNRYSQSILRRINSQKEFLDKNPSLYRKTINLVGSLSIDVAQTNKIEFFWDCLKVPVKIEKDGSLTEKSQIFETALLELKNNQAPSRMIAGVLEQVVNKADSDEQREALRVRIVGVYPDMQYLFLKE